jgi:hypothetical protein
VTGFDRQFASMVRDHLVARGTQVLSGLTPSDVRTIEEILDVAVPPDLVTWWEVGLPQGEEWPNWREPTVALARAQAWIEGAFETDILRGRIWLESWGAKPTQPRDALAVALDVVRSWPPLLPVYGHRFLPTFPAEAGNPVISIWEARDSTIFGNDLASYFHLEFKVPQPRWSTTFPRSVPKWGPALGLNRPRDPGIPDPFGSPGRS